MVVEGRRGRIYISPNQEHEEVAASATPAWEPEGILYDKALGFRVPAYGLSQWADLFTRRQLAALTNFSDLVAEAKTQVLADCAEMSVSRRHGNHQSINLSDSELGRLSESSSTAYADVVATYLAFAVDKASDRNTTLCAWESKMDRMRNTFGRQALPMVWDYAETNPLSGAGGDIAGTAYAIYEVLAKSHNTGTGTVSLIDATSNPYNVKTINISTDPPYYDNIGYADLSDFFTYGCVNRYLVSGQIYFDVYRHLRKLSLLLHHTATAVRMQQKNFLCRAWEKHSRQCTAPRLMIRLQYTMHSSNQSSLMPA
ncbi:hypothetical protein [Methylobacterium indicum]|uniref:Uncharacterized protein n=1 Tax=Methylobacterium indicum TaxID=1775910 RepID=A0A8H8WTK5_9HYPH|nr:hypothetical protein [Methylobacterium indicum]BCM84250.1 hypothetical protein mvi_27110 [Methylobacterium indicum]